MERVGSFDYKCDEDLSTDCRICSPLGLEKSATRMLSTLDWDFFHCSNCENWFQVSEKNHNLAFLIQDKKKLIALQYCGNSMDYESYQEVTRLIRRITRRVALLFDRLIPPYVEEGEV